MSDTLGALRRAAAVRLRAAGLPSPDLDARWLVAEAAGVPADAVVLRDGDSVAAGVVERLTGLLERRLGGAPVDRILGRRAFWGHEFRLTPATLSPRPDTEAVVAAALAALEGVAAPKILDLGVGSGAILVALLAERLDVIGLGIDRAEAGARVARANAAAAGVGDRALMIAGDWSAAARGPFDLVVSNPPYIPSAVVDGLAVEVREHDPCLALDGGADGLDAYRLILAAAPALLAPGAAVVLELGIGQEAEVVAIARAAGLVPDGPARPDLGGIARALVLRSEHRRPEVDGKTAAVIPDGA